MSGIGRGSRCSDGSSLDDQLHLVGDPVDVVTGAETHFETDFRLPDAPLPLSWVRHYDSRRCAVDRGVGPGFRLLLDLELRFDIDGISFVDGCGRETSFPFLTSDGDEAQANACVLERLGPLSYQVHRPNGEPTIVFTFARDLAQPARPTALVADRGRGRNVRFAYDNRGLAAMEIGTAGRLLIERDDARIAGVVLVGSGGQKKRLARYAYDALGRLQQAENGYGHSVSYTYEPGGRMARKLDRCGYSFFFSYDNQGRRVHTRGEDGVAEFRFEYRPYERLTVVTRGDGAQTRYFYDESGALIQVIDPCGGMSSYIQDAEGRTINRSARR